MRITIMALGVLGSFAAAAQVSAAPKKLFLDVHELGPGKVSAKDVAGAHQKDLATEKKFGVHFDRESGVESGTAPLFAVSIPAPRRSSRTWCTRG